MASKGPSSHGSANPYNSTHNPMMNNNNNNNVINTANTTTSSSSSNNNNNSSSAQLATALWHKQAKCNAEFFALTYGAMVAELVRDLEEGGSITNELDRMGHSIGVRCIEEVLAKTTASSSSSFGLANTNPANAASIGGGSGSSNATNTINNNNGTRTFVETAELMQTAFRMFFGLSVDAKILSDKAYTLSFADNPLAIFVELPAPLLLQQQQQQSTNATANSSNNMNKNNKLEYSQLLAGMVRGMLEMLQYDVSSWMQSTVLAGGDTNEIAVELKQVLQEGAGEDYQEE